MTRLVVVIRFSADPKPFGTTTTIFQVRAGISTGPLGTQAVVVAIPTHRVEEGRSLVELEVLAIRQARLAKKLTGIPKVILVVLTQGVAVVPPMEGLNMAKAKLRVARGA